MVMMKLMKAPAHGRITVEDKSVHQIFQQRPGREARQHQIEPIHARQVDKNDAGKRYGDEVAEVSNSPHHLDGQALNDSCSLHWITSPASKHRYHALIAGCVKSIAPLGERGDFRCWHISDMAGCPT